MKLFHTIASCLLAINLIVLIWGIIDTNFLFIVGLIGLFITIPAALISSPYFRGNSSGWNGFVGGSGWFNGGGDGGGDGDSSCS